MPDANNGHSAPRDSSTLRGRRAEACAARYLRALGWEVIATNVRCGRGEIDLIARDGRTIVFVEVRSRRQGSRFAPEATICAAKRERLVSAAAAWLARSPYGSRPCRFDVVAVDVSRAGYRVRLLRGAFVDDDAPS